MQDILGRGLSLGNLVVYNNKYYIIISEKELYGGLNVGRYRPKDSITVYLIQNLLPQETEIYNSIVEDYNAHTNELRIKKEVSVNKRKGLCKLVDTYERGDVFTHNYSTLLYLGLGKYEDVDLKTYDGHLYIVLNKEIKDGISLDTPDSLSEYVLIRSDVFSALFNIHDKLTPLNRDAIYTFKNKQPYEKVGHVNINTNKIALEKRYAHDWVCEPSLRESYPITITLF